MKSRSMQSHDRGVGREEITRVELIKSLRPWFRVALACDALDAMGLRAQGLDRTIKSLHAGWRLVGYAKTVVVEPVRAASKGAYSGLLDALQKIERGDVMVSMSTEDCGDALWGELMATACIAGGGAGAVSDGYARDYAELGSLPFPVFCRGTIPYDSRGRSEVTASGVPITVGAVTVKPGDLIVGDDDGVVVIPESATTEVVRLAEKKALTEDAFREEVRGGLRIGDAVAKYDIL